MANIQAIGRMETAVTPKLYLTVKDYSSPRPNGGLVLDKAESHNQSFALVSSSSFPYGQMMLVTHDLDYKLRWSDRETGSGGSSRHIIETIKTTREEIVQGKPIPKPSADYLWRIEQSDGNTVVFSGGYTPSPIYAIDVFMHGRDTVKAGAEVSGNSIKHGNSNQQWKFENSFKGANLQVVGRMETAVTPNLYLTVKDYSNPGPNGGLVLAESSANDQYFVFVSAPNFPPGQVMIVGFLMDYKLRMSDRATGSDGSSRNIIETIKIKDGEIAQGKPLHPTPSSDYLWQIEKRDGLTVVSNGAFVIDVYLPEGTAEAGSVVNGYFSKHGGTNQQWKLEKYPA